MLLLCFVAGANAVVVICPTFKLRGWPSQTLAGAPKVQKTAGRKESAYGQSRSNAGLDYLDSIFSRLFSKLEKETALMMSSASLWTNMSSSMPRASRFFRSLK